MIAACKAESKNEGARDKVRPMSAVTTKPVEGTEELQTKGPQSTSVFQMSI